MPLVAWSVLTYAAALIAAFSAPPGARLALGALALAATLIFSLSERRTHATILAVAAGAVLVASASEVFDARCAASLMRTSAWDAEFEADVVAGGLARARLHGNGCSTRATLLVASGFAKAGERAIVRGSASNGLHGIFVEDARVGARSSGSAALTARAAAGRRIDRIFGTDAPMVRALVIADMSAISAEQRDQYAQAGLVHMLSVSGLHVGIVALALELLASVLRLPRTPARVLTIALLSAYVIAIGAPPPAVRAAVMLGALLVGRLAQRPTSPWAILALGAAAPLFDARVAMDLGWQLSVAGTAALIAGGALSRRVIPDGWHGWRRTLAVGMLVSVVATLVTAPLSAWTFGRVSILGPVTNLLADPVMGLLQPLLFLAMAVPISGVESFVADAAHALLAAFDAIARVAAGIPHAAPVVLPSALGACAAGTASIAFIIACTSRHWERAALVACACIVLLIGEPMLPHPASAPELHMLDVGQGDAFALRTSRGRWIVVDAGRSWDGGDAARSTLIPYLAHRGGEVALFVLSHPHADHVGGAASLFAMLEPRRFLDPGYVGTSAPYRAALAQARASGISWQRVHPGDSLIVDDVVLTALAPDSSWAAMLDDANLASAVVMARMGRSRVLFTGDAEEPEEAWLLEHASGALHADVLKVGHHGSRTSTSEAFLAAVRPTLALVSVGAHNAYGHPDPGVMSLLRSYDVATLRTDQLGSVVLRFLDTGIEVTARDRQWFVPGR